MRFWPLRKEGQPQHEVHCTGHLGGLEAGSSVAAEATEDQQRDTIRIGSEGGEGQCATRCPEAARWAEEERREWLGQEIREMGENPIRYPGQEHLLPGEGEETERRGGKP